MVTKRTGRPRGRPKGSKLKFIDDPDRYRLALIDAAMEIYDVAFEQAALLAISVTEGEQVPPGKGKLSRSRERLLKRGWKLLAFERIKPTPKTGSQIDTLRLKSNKRYANDAAAQRWLHNMSNAWVNLLRHDRVGAAAELLIYNCCEAADEKDYAKNFMLPVLRSIRSAS
jgi:hypothetical protein